MHHIKISDNNYLKELLKLKFCEEIDADIAIQCIKEKSKDLNLLKESLKFCESEYLDIDDKLKSEVYKNNGIDLIKKFSSDLQSLEKLTEGNIKTLFDNFLGKNNIKLKNIASPLRIVLTGSRISPGIYNVIQILGKNLTLKRIKYFLS